MISAPADAPANTSEHGKSGGGQGSGQSQNGLLAAIELAAAAGDLELVRRLVALAERGR
jgi:hypothetical protein